MRKADFIANIKGIVKNGCIDYNKSDIRFLFHDYKDILHRDGVISDNQAQSWILTEKELKNILKNK